MESKQSGWKAYRPVLALGLLSLLVCGLIFPFVVTGIAQTVLPYQAHGSQVQLGSKTVGSLYIDNGFTQPIFFHGRNESNRLTASASGVDPDISLSDALSQISRIHGATGIPEPTLTGLVMTHEEWTLGIAGDPYVNVLELNVALISGNYSSVYAPYR